MVFKFDIQFNEPVKGFFFPKLLPSCVLLLLILLLPKDTDRFDGNL